MDIMMQQKFDKFWIGLIVGVLGALIGFSAFGFFWAIANDTTFKYFYKDVFIGTTFFTDKIVTISVLMDVLLFFLFMRYNWYNMCKGILAVVILAVPVAVYYY
jgi:ABC-type lipoprotein release transport system permease subunit